MAENIAIDRAAPKEIKYEQLLPQIKALIGEDRDEIAVMANVAAALHSSFDWLWTGFYRTVYDRLILGPFQGPVACMIIETGKGVCGTAHRTKETQLVPDVNLFPGHISCSADSRSEIVVPIIDKNSQVRAVLDVDSNQLNAFDQIDKKYLEELALWMGETLYSH